MSCYSKHKSLLRKSWEGFSEPSQQDQLNRRLTRLISQADTAAGVRAIVCKHGQSFNGMNTSAAVVRLARHQPDEPHEAQLYRRSLLLHKAWHLLLELLEAQVGQLTTQGCANVLWGLGTLQYAPEPLLTKLLQAAQATLPRLKAQELSNALWGLAKLQRHPGSEFLRDADKQFLKVMQDAKPQELSNALWGLAKLQWHPGLEVLRGADKQFLKVMQDAQSQHVTNVLWAYGQFSHFPGAPLLKQAVAFATQRWHVSFSSVASPAMRLRSALTRCVQALLPVHVAQILLGFTALSYGPGRAFMEAVAQRLLAAKPVASEAVRVFS